MHAPDGFLDPSVAAAMAIVAAIVLGKALRASEVELGDRRAARRRVRSIHLRCPDGEFPGGLGHDRPPARWRSQRSCSALGRVAGGRDRRRRSSARLRRRRPHCARLQHGQHGGRARLRWLGTVPGFRRLLPRNVGGVVGAGALAAGVSVVLSAMAFSLQWLFGATAPVAFDTVFGAMVGVHVLIGVGEAVITGLVVAAVMASRPDLVVGAADLSPTQLAGQPRVANRTFAIGAVLVALVLATAISQFAAGDPDGLERVAADTGFADTAEAQPFADGLFADYATRGLDNAG